MYIPQAVCITPADVKESWAVKYFQDNDVYNLLELKESHLKLALFILEER